MADSFDSWATSSQGSHDNGNRRTNHSSPLSLEVIAAACIRREAEALRDRSGYPMPLHFRSPSLSSASISTSALTDVLGSPSKTATPPNHQSFDGAEARAARQQSPSKVAPAKRSKRSGAPRKVHYECRKKLADARPRIKGRFVSKHTVKANSSP